MAERIEERGRVTVEQAVRGLREELDAKLGELTAKVDALLAKELTAESKLAAKIEQLLGKGLVEPGGKFVQERPALALGIALIFGLILGALLGRRGG